MQIKNLIYQLIYLIVSLLALFLELYLFIPVLVMGKEGFGPHDFIYLILLGLGNLFLIYLWYRLKNLRRFIFIDVISWFCIVVSSFSLLSCIFMLIISFKK